MFQNIESLKKDVNIYGQKVITDKTNVLLKDASKVILEGGKLDYSQLGSIRQRVSDIADDKKKYELGAELRKEYMQLGLANKDNITSIEGLIKGITAPLMDPNIKNATDLQAAMQDAYDKSLNLDRIGVKSVMNILPEEQIKGYGTNGKGDLVNYEFKGLKGSSYDVNTGKVIGPDAQKIKDVATTMKAQMPDYFENYRKRIGVNEDILPDSLIAKKLIDQIGVNQGQALNQSATSRSLEEARLQGQRIENQFAPEKNKAAIAHTNAQTFRIYNPIEKEGGGLSLNFGGGRTKENVNNFLKISEKGTTISSTLPKPFTMNLEGYSIYTKDPKDSKKKIQTPLGDFEVNSVEKIGKDRWIVKGFHADKSEKKTGVAATIEESLKTDRKRVNITLDKKGYNSFMNRIHGMGNAEQVETLNTVELMGYLTPKSQIGKVNPYKQIKLSDVYTKAQTDNVPVLYLLGQMDDAGFSIYNDIED
jgi:hypothetical protein